MSSCKNCGINTLDVGKLQDCAEGKCIGPCRHGLYSFRLERCRCKDKKKIQTLQSAVKVLYKEFNSKNYYRCGCTWIQDEKLLCPRHKALQNKDVIKAMELIK